MVDRVVVLHADDGMSFIADACAVMADAVNETRLVASGHADLVEAYAEMVWPSHGWSVPGCWTTARPSGSR